MRRHARYWMRALAALAALGAVHCGRSAPNPGGESQAGPPAQGAGKSHISGAEPTKLTVAAIAVVDVAPLHLGVAKGLFATEGLDVVVQSTQGGAESVPGVVSGQYQLGYANVVSLVLAHSKGLPLKLIAAGDFSLGKADDFGAVVVPPGSSLQTLKQLEGKTLAVNQVNNIGGVTVRAAMRQAGGDPDQLKFIELRFPEMPAALGQNRVDAAWLVEPFLTVAREQGARVIDWNFADAVPNLMIGAYFTTEGYIQSHPDVVARFTRAINRSLVYASEHPDEARASLLTYTKIDKLVADKLTLPLWSPQIGRDSMKRLAELMVQDKLIPRAPDLDALVR